MKRPFGNPTATYIACVFAVGALGACASPPGARSQTQLLGMSKKALLSCAGTPLSQERVQDWEYLTYIGGGDGNGDTSAVPTSPNTAMDPSSGNQPHCEATFLVKDGVVQRVDYQTRTRGVTTKGEPCAFIVANCVKP